ncbi:MAG: aminoacyl-tRNA hydrolase [Eubacteriales bacterium]|nr:aminoacyl-tRNA hydrolase [Eubacteriales bacterium]
MYLVTGLGNPGLKYKKTRHNTGFMAVDILADKLGIDIKEKKFKGLIGKGSFEGEQVMLLKPQTYMNLSGEAVRDVAGYYGIPVENIIVIYDDINLAPGFLRIRPKGSAGGHNGMKSIINCIGSDNFPRIRVGVGLNEVTDGEGRAIRTDLADHVLSKFSKEEEPLLKEALTRAAEASLFIIKNGAVAAQNEFNGKASSK